MNAALLPAFPDPVLDSQRVFRHALTALAEPACWRELRPVAHAPRPLTPPLAALLMTLCDRETSLWLDPACRTDEVRAWLRFHIACPVTDNPDQAAFAVILDSRAMPDLTAFAQGNAHYPERSTTLLLHTTQKGPRWRASGPGIPDTRDIRADLPDVFLPRWQDNHRSFPCGVDVILTDATHIAGLPRTTVLEVPCT